MKHFNFIRTFLVTYHVLLLLLLPLFIFLRGMPPRPIIIWTIILFSLCNLGVTVGYHRLFSHKTYDAHPMVELVLLFFGTLSLQGSAVAWSSDHRIHHRHVDTHKDPYNIQEGFWHAHIGWLFIDRKPDLSNVKDLLANKWLAFQHRHYLLLAASANIAVTLVAGFMFGDMFAAIVFIFLLRTFMSHHTTFFINSLAHTWGSKPYSREHSAVNNWIISLLTFGEGYHNYHHTFAGDYRNGVRWYQYDPSKSIIWILDKVGLAKQLKRSNKYAAQIRLIREDRKVMLEEMRLKGIAKYKAFELEMQDKYKALLESMQTLQQQHFEYKMLKKAKKEERRLVKAKIKTQKILVKYNTRVWAMLCKKVFS